MQIDGTAVGLASSAAEAADVAAIAARHGMPFDAAAAPRNYTLRYSRSASELHLLYWGECVVARGRRREDVREALELHLAALRPPAPGRLRLYGAFIADGAGLVGFPEGYRALAWRVAASLGGSARVVAGPCVELDGSGSITVPRHDGDGQLHGSLIGIGQRSPAAATFGTAADVATLASEGVLREPLGDLRLVRSMTGIVNLALDGRAVGAYAAAIRGIRRLDLGPDG